MIGRKEVNNPVSVSLLSGNRIIHSHTKNVPNAVNT